MMRTTRDRGPALLLVLCVGLCVLPASGRTAPARERAVEQIPELMGRILESQEQIREQESEMTPVLRGYDDRLMEAKRGIDGSSSEDEAADALVAYVEAYASRIEVQEEGLRAIESALVRMRADARELVRAAETAGQRRDSPEERQEFFGEQFQGVAVATGELAERLDRQDEASTAGAVLNASWASHGALDLPLPELGPEGATTFARKVEGLYARHQARSKQLRAERRAVRRLLDLLIERQLARRLDSLFAGSDALGLGSLLSGDDKSHDWQDLSFVVGRALGLPSRGGGEGGSDASLERLDYFANGGHRE